LFQNLIQPNGNPFIVTRNIRGSRFYRQSEYPIQYGREEVCINLTNITNGAYSISLSPPSQNYLTNGNLSFINNASVIGFSIPANSYPNPFSLGSPYVQANYIASNKFFTIEPSLGITSPLYNAFLSKLATKIFPMFSSTAQAAISASFTFSFPGPDLLYYQTGYTNVTFEVNKIGDNYQLSFISNKIVFGVYPNNNNEIGGTYTQG
ncbi:MAG: hypothetical protein RAK22_02815, partial [Nanoarchaeota archaeon]|nr:hypothetical protein [Nanoarchaeota archaeon]